MILGIDVGQKNMGVCVVSPQTKRISRWTVWESVGTWAKDVHGMLHQNATDDFLEGVSHVVIERQPSKNPSMTRIMHYLEFFFVTRGLHVTLQDPKHKLLYAAASPWFPGDSTDREWTYRHRKKLAVQTVDTMLLEDRDNQPLAHVFKDSKKKDDLADALLHALAYGTFAAADCKPKKKKKVMARIPTERQRRTGKLSPSNVKHLLKGCDTEPDIARKCKDDKALARCLRKHFGSAAGFLEESI